MSSFTNPFALTDPIFFAGFDNNPKLSKSSKCLRMAADCLPNAMQTPASEQTDCKNFVRTLGSVLRRNLPILRVAVCFKYFVLNAAILDLSGDKSIVFGTFRDLGLEIERTVDDFWLRGTDMQSAFILRVKLSLQYLYLLPFV